MRPSITGGTSKGSHLERPSGFPRSTHGLVEVGVGVGVVEEALGLGVEAEDAAGLQGGLGEVDEGAGAVAVAFVEGELLARFDGLDEVGELGFGLLEFGEFLLEVRDVGLETFHELAVGAFDEGGLLVAVFAVDDDFAAVFIFEADDAEGADGVAILLRGIGFDLDGAFVVLAENVLHGIEVMLAHIAEAAAIVVPVAAEGAVDAVGVVGLEGGGAEPEFVIEIRGDGLRGEVGAADPIEFPIEAGAGIERDFERPAQETVLHRFLDGLDGRAHAVEAVLEAEPGVEAEDALMLFDGGDHGFAFADGAGHRLFAPDILAGLGGLDGHDGVPVGRGGDMDDINVLAGEHFAEIAVTFAIGPAFLHRGIEVVLVDIAHGEELAGGVDAFDVAQAHAAGADDGAGEHLAGGDVAGTPQQPAGDDVEGGKGGEGCFEEVSPGETMSLIHVGLQPGVC